MDDRFEAFGTSRYLMLALFIVAIPLLIWQERRVSLENWRRRRPGADKRRIGTATAAIALLVLVACGSQQESLRSSRGNSEPTTVAGLAAAALTHLDPNSAMSRGGNRNKYEKWMGVGFDVEAAGATVPLDVDGDGVHR